jgi:hypothetical protein
MSKELDELRRLPKQARLDLLTQITLDRLLALTKESAQEPEPIQEKVVGIEKGASESREEALTEAIEKETDPVEKARLQAKVRAALLPKR